MRVTMVTAILIKVIDDREYTAEELKEYLNSVGIEEDLIPLYNNKAVQIKCRSCKGDLAVEDETKCFDCELVIHRTCNCETHCHWIIAAQLAQKLQNSNMIGVFSQCCSACLPNHPNYRKTTETAMRMFNWAFKDAKFKVVDIPDTDGMCFWKAVYAGSKDWQYNAG